MDRIAKFLVLLAAALVLVPGCFAEEAMTNETTNATDVTELVEVTEDVNGTVSDVVVEEVAEAIKADHFANMTVTTLEKVGVNQTIEIALMAEDAGLWNVTKTEGLEQVGNATVINGTDVFTIKAITVGEQEFTAVHEAANETATEAGETYKLAIIVE